ncbi:SpoIIE family protein phosphatase [Streptomyces sp. NPDC002446]
MSDGFWSTEPTPAEAGPALPGGLLDVLGVAVVVLDSEGRIVLWGPQAEELFGYASHEALGALAVRFLVDEEHLDLAIDLFAEVIEDGEPWAGVLPIRCKDGSTRLVEFRNMRLEDQHGTFFALGLAGDRSTLRRVERDLALSVRLISQTPIGVGVLDPELRFVTVNAALERLNGLPAAEHIGRHVREVLPFLDTEAIEATMRQVLATGKPELDQFTTGRTPDSPERERAWRVSYYCLEDPAGNVLGLATSVVDVTEQHYAAMQAARARRQLALIADASKRVGTTLEVDTTARELAEVCVPELADAATVALLDRFTECAHPADHPAFHLAAAAPPAAAAPCGSSVPDAADPLVVQCLETGKPIRALGSSPAVPPDASSPVPDGVARHPRLVVPLIAHDQVIGALDLKRSTTSHPYDDDDLSLAQELASRAAVCIDNARGYQSQRQAAEALQRHLLPHQPPTRSGLEIAYRYRPARSAGSVGGDWFDVIPTSRERTALIIGDVMGSGIPAAATMGQLRTAIRTLATLGLDPAHILQHVDANVTGLEHDIATCVVADYDPHQAACRIATAGHLPPVLLRAGQSPVLLDLPSGAPLGVGGVTFHTTRLRLSPGDRLVLYTDGLVETRDEPIDDRLAALLRVLADPPTSLESVCDLLLNALRSDEHDDATLLIAQATRPPGSLGREGGPYQ